MSDRPMQPLVLVSGLSGSGKSVALNALEDHGYYCVDNLPGALLPALAGQIESNPQRYQRLAVGIDARAGAEELAQLPDLIGQLSLPFDLIFLTILPRFAMALAFHGVQPKG